jgi:hypothetical protein
MSDATFTAVTDAHRKDKQSAMRAEVLDFKSRSIGGPTVLQKLAELWVREQPARPNPIQTSGDGGGSNSPSRALERIASTSVASGLLSRGPGRALTRFRFRQPVIFDPPTGHSVDRSPANYALPGPRGGDREDGH